MPTFNLLYNALTLNKTSWKRHGDFTCQWMGDNGSICLLPTIIYGIGSLSYTDFAVDSDRGSRERFTEPQ